MICIYGRRKNENQNQQIAPTIENSPHKLVRLRWQILDIENSQIVHKHFAVKK